MLQLIKLTKQYNDLVVLKEITQTFPKTGLICLMGPSGSGKSSLFNLIAGFDREYEGDIVFNQTPLKTLSNSQLSDYRNTNIGFIFQDYNLLSAYSVYENIMLACGNDPAKEAEIIDNLKRMDLLEKKDENVANLSGGEKQRIAIIRSLINNPQIILADEPTGSLDRDNAKATMHLLQAISKDRLVLMITHDIKLSAYADQSIKIESRGLIGMDLEVEEEGSSKLQTEPKNSKTNLGIKSFKVHLKTFFSVALALALGVAIFMMSLSSSNIIEREMNGFKEKNTAYNNGYIKIEDNEAVVMDHLGTDDRVSIIYKQYILKNIELESKNQSVKMDEKYPMPKAKEEMSYGVMPVRGNNEIALSPSLARKFKEDISQLLGETIQIKHDKQIIELKVSGIFNASYDDFYVSQDIEVQLYQDENQDSLFSVSYEVATFEDVVGVDQSLRDATISVVSAAKSVDVLMQTFKNLSSIFSFVSILIFAAALFIAGILMWKQHNARFKEIGILSALGYSRKTLNKMLRTESMALSLLALVLNAVLLGVLHLASEFFNWGLSITLVQCVISAGVTFALVLMLGSLSSKQLINKDPAVALRN